MLKLPTFQDVQQPVMTVLQKILQYEYNVRINPTDTEIALFVAYTAMVAMITYLAVQDVRRAISEFQDLENRFIQFVRNSEIATEKTDKIIRAKNSRIKLLTLRLRQKEDELRLIKEAVIDDLLPIINGLQAQSPLKFMLIEMAKKYQTGTLQLVEENCTCEDHVVGSDSSDQSPSSSDDSSDSDYVPPSTQKRRRT